MEEQIKVSAKNLGQVGLADFCPRCYWVKLKARNKLPWQIFPGIFSSIDAYTKKVAHHFIDNILTQDPPLPQWLADMGPVKGYLAKTPHWSKFSRDFPEYGITLNGVVDDIFYLQDGSHVIPDYKTAKYTENQDKLLPMYRIQLNGYAEIADACGFAPVSGLFLVYFQPETDTLEGMTAGYGFDMAFFAKTVPVEIDKREFYAAMAKTREIFDRPRPPAGAAKCKDCAALAGVQLSLAAGANHSGREEAP